MNNKPVTNIDNVPGFKILPSTQKNIIDTYTSAWKLRENALLTKGDDISQIDTEPIQSMKEFIEEHYQKIKNKKVFIDEVHDISQETTYDSQVFANLYNEELAKENIDIERLYAIITYANKDFDSYIAIEDIDIPSWQEEKGSYSNIVDFLKAYHPNTTSSSLIKLDPGAYGALHNKKSVKYLIPNGKVRYGDNPLERKEALFPDSTMREIARKDYNYRNFLRREYLD